eukprot:scaffold186997_cov28-Prasinocladus_malaysianus.AAC.1
MNMLNRLAASREWQVMAKPWVQARSTPPFGPYEQHSTLHGTEQPHRLSMLSIHLSYHLASS